MHVTSSKLIAWCWIHHWSMSNSLSTHCWFIVDTSLMHCWSTVDLSRSIVTVDITCNHIYGWNNYWKVSILDCTKLTLTNPECQTWRPCIFVLVFKFDLVLQLVQYFYMWDIAYYKCSEWKRWMSFLVLCRKEKCSWQLFKFFFICTHCMSWELSDKHGRRDYPIFPRGWYCCQYEEIKSDLLIVSYVYLDYSL